MLGILKSMWRNTCLNPCPLVRTIKYNFLRGNSFRESTNSLLMLTSYSVLDIHRTAKLEIKGLTTFGFKKYRGSRVETSLWMDRNSSLKVHNLSVYHGCDIQIFKGAKVDIARGCIMNRGAQIICQEEVTIGEGCLISRGVVIRDNDGGHSILTKDYKKSAPVHIGNHVWIGQNAIIMKGVTIGDGAIIGAGAFVCTNVKPKSLIMADPSRAFAKDVEWIA